MNPYKNVYILGTGFSNAIAGFPVMKDFFDKMKDCCYELSRHDPSIDEILQEFLCISEVLDYRQKLAPAAEKMNLDLDNIEDLLCLIDALPPERQTEKIKLGALSTAIAATIRYSWISRCHEWMTGQYLRSLTFAEKRLDENWEPGIGFKIIHPQCISLSPELIDVFISGEKNILSDNKFQSIGIKVSETKRDTSVILEVRLPEGMQRIYCMVASPKGLPIENVFITFNYDEVLEYFLRLMGYPIDYKVGLLKPFGLAQSPTPEPIPVLKLHGSVNWYLKKVKKEDKIKIADSYDDIRGNEEKIPYLLPPTWKKNDAKINRIWATAIRHISEASRIFIIGYSIPQTDLHFKYLLAAGLAGNIGLKEIVFINPDKEMGARWDWLFGDESRPIRKRIKRVDSLPQAPSFYGR